MYWKRNMDLYNRDSSNILYYYTRNGSLLIDSKLWKYVFAHWAVDKFLSYGDIYRKYILEKKYGFR